MGFDRITFDNKVMGGQACVRNLRVPVSLIINMVANGASFSQIREDYEYLEDEDIRQALNYAAWTTRDCVLAV